MTLTLQEIRDHSPCQTGWKKLTKAVGNDMTTKLSIGDVVLSNGLDDALWCLRCLKTKKRVAGIISAVKRAAVHSKDQRVHDCVKDIEKWLAGDNSINLLAAESAAWEAAESAADSAAESAADSAAWAAAWVAADSAAESARAAAESAARAAWAARTTAEPVAESEAESEARAAWVAAEPVAESAARAAADSVAWAAARAARAAAWAAARELQKSDLLKMFPPVILKENENG